MNLIDLFEYRREHEVNVQVAPRTPTGHKAAASFLMNQIPFDQLINYGVTMTGSFKSGDTPVGTKFGINPKSNYDTPIGIYFYPALYYLDYKRKDRDLPYVDDLPYIQIFQFTSNRILNVASLKATEEKKIYKKLRQVLSKPPYKADQDQPDPPLDDWIKEVSGWALTDTPGFRIWNLLKIVMRYYHLHTTGNVALNKLIRLIGYDIVLDMSPSTARGRGVIHSNEPTQGFLLNATFGRVVKVIENVSKVPPRQEVIDVYRSAARGIKPPGIDSASEAYYYALSNRKPWPVGSIPENLIASSRPYAVSYANMVLHGGWRPGSAGDKKILSKFDNESMDYVINIAKREVPENSAWFKKLLTYTEELLDYTILCRRKPWPEGSEPEKIIASSTPFIASRYAAEFKRPWPKDSVAEKSISSSANYATNYAIWINRPWPENSKGERVIASEASWAVKYAVYFKKPWPEDSDAIRNIIDDGKNDAFHELRQYVHGLHLNLDENSKLYKAITSEVRSAYYFMIKTLKRPYPAGSDGEKIIASDSSYVIGQVEKFRKPFEDYRSIDDTMSKHIFDALLYTKLTKFEWPEESKTYKAISENPDDALNYVTNSLKKPVPVGSRMERSIKKNKKIRSQYEDFVNAFNSKKASLKNK